VAQQFRNQVRNRNQLAETTRFNLIIVSYGCLLRLVCSTALSIPVPALPAAPISTDHIYVLGDDSKGSSEPHSTAIAVGKKCVLACAHSLALIADASKRSTKSRQFLMYEDQYWIQPTISITQDGNCSDFGRIPIRLYKFHPDNDWALFVRDDGLEFSYFATIDTSPSMIPPNSLPNVRKPAVVLHCPVSLLNNFTDHVGEYMVNCNSKEDFRIQTVSSHHIYYDGGNLVRGSSGGGVHWIDSNLLFAMHTEVVNEAMFDEEEHKRDIAISPKQVTSEDYPYPEVALSASNQATKRQKTCESETIRSLSGGNQGQGRAIIVSRFKRLMHYIAVIESTP
jgi:hypothetical protein